MFKLRVLKAVAFAVLIAFTTQCISYANPDIFTRNAWVDSDTLAPELYLQKRGIEMQSLMFLADITRQALQAGVKPDKLSDFIRSASTITSGIAARIDFENTTITGDKVHIGYKGAKGICILTFGLIPEHIKGRIPPSEGRIQIADMIVEIRSSFRHPTDADTGPAEETSGQDDVTGAAESNVADHEAEKEFKSPLGGLLSKLFKRWGKWKVRGNRGVNDVIRSFWKSDKPGSGCELCEDIPAVLRFLYNSLDGNSIGESILANGYKVYVYDTEKYDFANGVTTHYGIRTGSIHITRKEYERLKALGIGHLAARIAHEVSELDSWRQKADKLIAEGKIDELGAVSGVYNGKWENGIRKWIRENCEGSGRGYAQNLDREFHRKGIEKEIAVLASGLLDQAGQNREEYCKAVRELAQSFISGSYEELVTSPGKTYPTPGGMFSGIFSSILGSLKHLTIQKDREFFLNVLCVRASLEYARALNGGMDVSQAGKKDQGVKRRDVLSRLEIIKEGLNGVEVIDAASREYVQEWIEEVEAKIKEFPFKTQETFAPILAALKKQLSQKHRATGWEEPYASDPRDVIGASSQDQPGQDEPGYIEEEAEEEVVLHVDTTSGGTSQRAGLGEIVSPELAACIKPQNRTVTRSLEVDPVINIIRIYNNWSYRDLSDRSKSSTVRKKDTTKGAVEKATNYMHIARFTDERVFRKRVGAATRSAMHLINNPEILKLTNSSRNFRVFYGSPSGYFDVLDTKKDYAHQIEVTILVDGKREQEEKIYGPASEEMASVLDEFKPQNNEEAEYLPPVRGIKVNVVGLETVKAGFFGLSGVKRSKKEIEWRKGLQRLFVRLYREDIQVAGSNLVEENKEFAEALPAFERKYIAELVDQLDRIVREKQEVLAEKDRIAVTELSADEERQMREISAGLRENEARLHALKTEQQEVAVRRKVLDEEQQRLNDIYKYLQDYQKRRDAGEVVLPEESQTYSENVRKYTAELETWQKTLGAVTQDEGRISGSLQALVPDMQRKQNALGGLESRKVRAEKMRKAFEFQSQNLDRHYELLCKRIEDAQFGHPLTTGVVISNRYRVMEKLGQGGFGAVYRVFDRELGQEKAIKIMSPTQHMNLADKQRALLSFERELESMLKLREAGAQVPYVEGRGTYAGSQFFVMSLVRGLTFEEIIDKDRKGERQLSLREKLILMYAVAKTIARFHVAKFIHRDIKPANMMIPVNEDGSLAIPDIGDIEQLLKSASFDAFVRKISVIDLGSTIPGEISDMKETGDFKALSDRTNITGQGNFFGTPYYMAPEQVAPNADTPIGSKTDVYSMGIMFYRLLSHHYPRGEGLKDAKEIVLSHFSHEPIVWLCDQVDRNNLELQEKREKDRSVDVKRLNTIKDGLAEKLAGETREGKRIIARGKDGKLLWYKKVLDETVLMETLGNIAWLNDAERDKIRAIVIRRIPQADGFIEAIAHQMLKQTSPDRPTADEVATEIEKYLRDKRDEMIYRPRGEKRQKGLIVSGAEWFQRHIAFFMATMFIVIGGLAGLLIFVSYLYNQAIGERARALQETEAAKEEMAGAVRAKNEAEQAVQGAQEKMRQLEEERKKINESLEVLRRERGTVEEQKKSLSEQVQALSDKAKRALELEEKLKEMEERVKQLNEQELKLKQREEALNRKIKESEENLKKAETELEKRRGTLTGVLEDARAAAQKFDAETTLSILDRKLFWWTIDKDALKKYTLGIDEISKIMTDNGQIDEALKLENDRISKLSRLAGFQETDEARLPYQEELVRAQLMAIRLHQLKGDYTAAERYAQQLMAMQAYKDSKDRMEALRNSLMQVLLEAAVNVEKEDEKKTCLAKVEGHVKLLESEDKKNLYYGNLYLAKGDYRNAAKYFTYYHDHWAKQAAEEGIAAGIKAQREREAAYALLLSAAAYRQQAAGYMAQGNAASMKSSCDYAQAYLERIAKEYAKQKEVLAWAELIRGELLALQGETDKAKEAYTKAAAEAEANKLQLLFILARSRMGAAVSLADLVDTWTELVSGKIPVPLPYVEELKKLLREESSRHQKEAEEAKRKAEEETRKAAEEKRRAEEAAKRQAEETALREQVLKGIGTAQDAKVKLIQVNKEIQTLTGQVGLEQDRGKRASMERQLERARKEKEILQRFIEEKKEEAPREEKPAEEEDKGADRSDESKKDGIGSSILDAPDERLVDALIECAFEDYLFSQVETNGIREVFLGTDTCRTFFDIYNKLTKKEERLRAKFEELCKTDRVPGMAIAKIYAEDLEKLKNIAGHAGRFTNRRPDVGVPSIYVARGYIDRDTLINHERMELFVHLQEAARRLGYMSWDTILDDRTRRRAVKDLEEADDYGKFVLRAHLMANEEFRVSDDEELVPDKKKQDGILDIAAHYRRMPIAAEQDGETPKPVFDLSILLHTIGKIAGTLASVMNVKADSFMGAGKTEADKKGVIIYADDIMDCSAVFDLNKLAEVAGNKDGAIGTVVLYARDQRKADLVEKMIVDADPKANVVVITEEDIKGHYGKDYYTTDQSQTEMLLRYVTNRKAGIFPKSDRILGLIRGPLRNGEDAETLKKELKAMKVPAVIFENDQKGNVYSVMQALSKLMEARSSERDLTDELLIVLPPITRISEALQKEYQVYKAMMQALESAA